jgi:hypothetical protein
MKRVRVERPGPDATPEEIAEWKRMHAELGKETAAKLHRIMKKVPSKGLLSEHLND